jgi:S-adenosylmethionine decarboxylase
MSNRSPNMHHVIGQHLLADFHSCSQSTLINPIDIETTLKKAAQSAGATVISSYFHHFGEQLGVTGVLLLKESHMSIHTWPELNYCAIDIFMCGTAQIDAALTILNHYFQPEETSIHTIPRGLTP